MIVKTGSKILKTGGSKFLKNYGLKWSIVPEKSHPSSSATAFSFR